MFQRLTRVLTAAILLSGFTLASSGVAAFAADDPGVPPPTGGSHQHTEQRVCDLASTAAAACHARRRTDRDATLARPASGKHPSKARPDVLGNNGAYDPSYLQSAYNTPSASGGAGLTVAIVDAYDSPSAESDLANYRSFFGLPACSSASGCFRKVNESGQASPLPVANSGWAQEISLDLDMVSAICPNCHILLVEANSANFSDLGTAVNTAVSMGATSVSNSYGGNEFSSETSADSSYFNHPGVTITVSSGDSGYGVEYPAASRFVTAVGGTTLNQTGNTGARNATETAWSGAGSGCSVYETKPTWQSDTGCSRRTVADVSADADPNTGVWVIYKGGWYVFGGTSVASPIIASVTALAGTAPSGGYPSSFPYGATSALNDVLSGSNGGCGSYLCNAEPGFDGPTGLGTPNGANAFTSHTTTADFSVAASPASATGAPGGSATSTVTLASTGGYASSVNLSASGLPSGATASFSPNPITPTSAGASSTLTVSLASNVPTGSYPLTITATGTDSQTTTHTAGVTLVVATANVVDFSLSVSPSSQSVSTGGGNASYTVSLASVNGYNSSVNLAVSGLPSGASANFSPAAVTPASPAATSSLSVTVPSGTAAQTYTLTITGTGTDGAATTHSVTASLVVAAPGTYSLAVSPSSQSAGRGGTASYTTTLTTSSGFSSAVNLAVSGLPSGATASFNPTSVVPTSGGATSTLQVQVGSGVAVGSYTLTVTGTGTDSAKTTQTATMTLNVDDFSLAAASSSLTVFRGTSVSDVLDLTGLGGYSSSVSLSVTGLPPRTTASFSANPVTPTASGANSTLAIRTRFGTPTGTRMLTITGAGADGTTHTVTVTLTVN